MRIDSSLVDEWVTYSSISEFGYLATVSMKSIAAYRHDTAEGGYGANLPNDNCVINGEGFCFLQTIEM